MRARNHVGELRPSQLMHTFGVGSTVELPELTALVLGLDEWPDGLGAAVSEPRLLAALRAEIGPGLQKLLTPPVVEDGDPRGVPVAPFPRWLRCPLCNLLAPIDGGLFELKVDPWRPERTTYVHPGCSKMRGGRPPTAFPARYLVSCSAGHLDDFPWVEFLHGGLPCKGTLRLVELGRGGRPGDIQLSCDMCGRRRRLSQAFGPDAAPYLPPHCRGRHPHLGTFEGCERPLETLLLGASNAWFPVQRSALSIPSRAGEVAQAVDRHWALLEPMPGGVEVLNYALESNPALKELQPLVDEVGPDALLAAIEDRRAGLSDADAGDLRGPEWDVLRTPDEAPGGEDFQLRSVGPPDRFTAQLADVVLVERLREVSALRGFTRLNAPDDVAGAGGEIAPLARGKTTWLPCSEVRGEGIFVRFDEPAVAAWEQAYRTSGRAGELQAGHRAWRARRKLDPDEGWPGERYVLLHSFAHALIRELSLECGYNASSIRERLYASAEPERPMAGVLLYTAAPDSEGTLGGLVELGRPEHLGPLLRQALERAQLCSSDPLCADHAPTADASMHAAACHACQFASETSCERGNRYLDRATLTRTIAGEDAAFFPAP